MMICLVVLVTVVHFMAADENPYVAIRLSSSTGDSIQQRRFKHAWGIQVLQHDCILEKNQ